MPELSHILQTGVVADQESRLRQVADVCLILLLATLWPLTHRYKGLGGDAELYAVQALARIHPNLAGDLFLQNNSQDRYTIFSPLYAWCIRWAGLRGAATGLVVVFKLWFYAVTWALARTLVDRRIAFLSTAFVMIIAGSYGGYSVFNYAEDWCTARTLAEPLVVSALLLYFRGYKAGAFVTVIIAFFVHPLMTLPGLLLLLMLWLPIRIGAAGAALGVTTALGIALRGLYQPPGVAALSVMNADWLEVVRERSVFLFSQFWPAADWQLNAQPFVSLAISALVIPDYRIKRLCAASGIVGAAGLLIGLIASSIGPVGLLLQGQAWRWVWIARFTAVLLLAPTLLHMWKDRKCGPLCAALIFLGWTFSAVDSDPCLFAALVLWSARRHVTERAGAYCRWAAAILAAVVVAWALANSWSIVTSPAPESGLEPALVTNVRNIFGLGVVPIALAWLLGSWVYVTSCRAVPAVLSALLAVCCLLLYPGAFRVSMRDGSTEQIAEFSDWRRSIAPDDTVFVVPAHNSATFAWFTLERPSYLSVDQSAGVVFSPITALEVRRRSAVLAPLMDPDWKLLSGRASIRPGGETANKRAGALTRDILIGICRDPILKFVVAREELGFEPVTHRHVGNWKDWNLYDCRNVLAAVAPA